ncbi:MAG: SDR family oxidoreductase [Clostridia bacterium]|nr:SDR family oxidoreductase [Clostridia bacterium]
MAHVFVTGGSRGIGAAMVRRFRDAGYAVSFTYRTSAGAQDFARRTGALALCADGTDEAAVREAFRLARERHGPVDALINCAGVSSFQLFQDVDTPLWEQTVAVNLRAPFFCIREVLPEMIRRGSGTILNVSSVWGMVGSACEVLYSTTKAGLIGMTKALAKEVGPSGIRVNCIAPGVIDTDMNAALPAETREELCHDTPLGRMGTPDEVAGLALYLVRDDTFLTGQVISPNGGFVIT